MESVSGLFSERKNFNYFGKGSTFLLIFFKNLLLTFITLGVYYPWAKVEILKYHYKSTELNKNSFVFHGTGKEVFIGFIKIYVLLILFYLLLGYGTLSANPNFTGLIIGLFYSLFFFLIPFLIHGAVRYRASRSSWRGISFTYLGDKMELFWKCIIGSLITLFTLGIYGSWFSVDIRKYILSHLRYGNLSFDFKGEGQQLFIIRFKFFVLGILTFGIYTIWYTKELLTFYANHTTITQNGKEVNFLFKAKLGDVFELLLVNLFLIIFTFGLATPWVIIRNQKFIFRFLEIEEGLDINTIQNIKYDQYKNTSKHNFLDVLDIDLL